MATLEESESDDSVCFCDDSVESADILPVWSSPCPMQLDNSVESTESDCSSAEEDSYSDDQHDHSGSLSDETDNLSQNPSSTMFEPFYVGSSVSLCGAICAVMHFCRSNKLSYTAIADLLKLLEILCPTPNELPKTVYKLKKFIKQYNMQYDIFEYCSESFQKVEDCSCENGCLTTCHMVDSPVEKPLEVIIASM